MWRHTLQPVGVDGRSPVIAGLGFKSIRNIFAWTCIVIAGSAFVKICIAPLLRSMSPQSFVVGIGRSIK
jgi:hypothetical protein